MSEEEVRNPEETDERKPGKKKGCLTIVIILIALIALVGACGGDGEEIDPEQPEQQEQQAAQTLTGDEEEKVYTEEQKAAFQDWYDQVLAAHKIADDASAEYETIVNSMSNGKLTIFEVYDQTNSIKNRVKSAWRTLNDIKTPDVLNKEHHKQLDEAISDLSTGLYVKTEGFEKILEYLDDQKPSTLSEANEKLEASQAFMMGGIAKIVGVQSELGLIDKQETQEKQQ